MSQNNNFAYHT